MTQGSGTTRRLGAILGFALGAVLLVGPGSALAATVYVDGTEPGGPGRGTQANPCRTIQEGVNAANPTDTVQVAAGTYTEQVDIDKELVLDGASPSGGPDQTIVAAPPLPPGTPPPSCPDPSILCDKFGAGDNRPVIFVHGVDEPDRVTIQDLEVAGNGRGTPAFDFYGIAYVNAGGRISNVRVSHVRNNPADANTTGYAIYNTNVDNSGRVFEVLESVAFDYQDTGITATGTSLAVNLDANIVVGNGLNALLPQTGILIGPGTGGTLTGNAVGNHKCYVSSIPACGNDLLAQQQAAGIRLDTEAATHVGVAGPPLDGNLIGDNDVGILDRDSDATRDMIANNISGNRYAGIFTNDGTIDARANSVNGTLTVGNADSGIAIASEAGGHVPTANMLIGNTVTNAKHGIRVFDDANVSTSSPSVAAHFNRIVDNITAGLSSTLTNPTAAQVDAENNWWGCNAGPGNSPGCDDVLNGGTGSVDFNPWLILTADAAPRTIVRGDTAAVTGRLTENSDGATPANNQFPDGTSVSFSTNNGTIESPRPTQNAVASSTVRPSTVSPPLTQTSASLDNQSAAAPTIRVLQSGRCSNPQTGSGNGETLNGTLAGDLLKGLAGDDLLRGRRGDDCLQGGPDNDRLEGGAQDDKLSGGQQGDQLIGGAGVDTFKAGSGDDHINAFDNRHHEQIDCGLGFDRVDANFGDVTVNCESVNRH